MRSAIPYTAQLSNMSPHHDDKQQVWRPEENRNDGELRVVGIEAGRRTDCEPSKDPMREIAEAMVEAEDCLDEFAWEMFREARRVSRELED